MSEPEDPRWLEEIGPELRKNVPVRDEWRAHLLEEITRAPRPSAGDPYDQDESSSTIPVRGSLAGDIRDTGEMPRRAGRRRIVLHPLAGLAAAVTFVALGVGATLVTLEVRSRDRMTVEAIDAGALPAAPAAMQNAATSHDRELVRFELWAPQATHVAVVGSFNRWNPQATPLLRDSVTGRWRVAVRLPPGRHVYAFLVDGDVTADPAAPRAADDDFGSANSVVLVSGPAT